MKQFLTLLIWCVLALQLGFGQCELEINWILNIDANGTAECNDDIFTVLVTPSGINTGTEGCIATDNQENTYSLNYNQAFEIGPISPLPGNYEVVFTDVELPSCETTINVPLDNPNCAGVGAIHLSLGSLEACAGEAICIPLTAHEFDDVLGCQFSVNYNAASLTYTGAQNHNPLLPGFGFGHIGNPLAGNLSFTWNDPNVVGVSLPDETVIVEFCFTTTSGGEMSTILSFSEEVFPIEFVDGNELTVTPNLTNGQVTSPITINTSNMLLLDNGTPNQCSDDSFRLEILVENTNEEVTVWHAYDDDNELLFNGTYGVALEVGPFPVYEEGQERYTLSFTVEDGELENCRRSFEFTPPEAELCACTLMAEIVTYSCEDNDTAGDPSDDFFHAWIDISGTTNGWITEDESVNSEGSDGLYAFGPYQMVDGIHELIIIDENSVDCAISFSLFPIDCDSPSCELTISQIGVQTFLDNGTPDQCSDDTYAISLQVNAIGTVSTNWRVVLNDGSFSEVFPYGEEILLDFLPVYDECGNLNNSFPIVDAINIACVENINITASPPVDACNCEAFLCYSEVGLDDNGTPFDCSDDFMEIQVEASFIAPLGTEYELLLDDEVVHSSSMSAPISSILVPTDGIPHTLTLRDIDNSLCTTSELLPVFELCGGNDSFYLSLGDVNACAGEPICVPLIAHRFDNILGFQFSINYNADKITYTGVQNASTLLFGFTPGGSIGNPWPGAIVSTWNDPGASGKSIPDGTILIELCFVSNLTGSGGQQTVISFSDTPTPIEVIDGDEMEVTPLLDSGQISCECFTQNECNLLQGQVLSSNDCLSGETPLNNWLIEFSNEDYLQYTRSDAMGGYSINLPTGNFNVRLFTSTDAWNVCQTDGYTVEFATVGETQNLNLLAQAVEECALLEVSMNVGTLRRCFEDQVITINYVNVGTIPLEDGLIGLLLPAELNYNTTNGTYLGNSGDTLLFAPHLPLSLGAEGQFEVYVDVSCEATLNSTLCVTALSMPYQICPSPDENWSGASLLVTGECTGEEVIFRLRNVGDNPLSIGNNYIIIQDGVMLFEVPEDVPPLPPGESTEVSFTADGSTYRIEATQEPFHPGASYPTAVVEGCGVNEDGEISTGFVNQFPNDDENVFIDEDCRIVTGAYDPNDKQAEPRGYGEEHYILPRQLLEYTIRFQNTGNDTAFTVVIRDTLSDWLDMQTFRPGVSSHAYELSLDTAHALSFIFNDIFLPDSTTNFLASQGFITYQIHPKLETPLETRIENTAAIYFDFNEPIITNTTNHQVGDNFIDLINWVGHQKEQIEWQFFPNPTSGELTLKSSAYKQGTSLKIMDALGREKAIHKINEQYTIIDLEPLPTGWYILQVISENGQLLASGKLVRI